MSPGQASEDGETLEKLCRGAAPPTTWFPAKEFMASVSSSVLHIVGDENKDGSVCKEKEAKRWKRQSIA